MLILGFLFGLIQGVQAGQSEADIQIKNAYRATLYVQQINFRAADCSDENITVTSDASGVFKLATCTVPLPKGSIQQTATFKTPSLQFSCNSTLQMEANVSSDSYIITWKNSDQTIESRNASMNIQQCWNRFMSGRPRMDVSYFVPSDEQVQYTGRLP